MTSTLSPPGQPRTGSTAPKRGRKTKRVRTRRRVWARRVLLGGTLGMLAGTVFAVAAVMYAWGTVQLPEDVPLSQTTFITDAQGERLASFNSGENRVEVPLDTIPPVLRDAVLATEDRSFYDHRGIDPRGILRALWNDLRNRSAVQGGSTITQQYVKTQYVGQERTVTRKFREAILAMKLEQRYSKDEILRRYLNAIYFGRGAYGVQAASKSYFGKDVQQLGIGESAYLAGLIRAPELADAYAAPEEATRRRDLALGSMVSDSRLGQPEADAVRAVPVQSYVIARTAQEPSVFHADKGTQYFIDYVRRALVQRYGEETVLRGGLRVKTTLDMNLQTQAFDSVYGFLRPGEPAGALVTVNDRGEIKAMVGGRDYKESQVNLAVGTEGGGTGRPAGSTFKPFALAAAVENGMSVRETFPGPARMTLRQENGQSWPVSNFGDESFGRIDLVQATVNSVNTVYAQLVIEEGVDSLVEMARASGIRSPLAPNDALVLGTDSVSPLEMASAYMTFGLRGEHVEPTALMEVRNADGELLEAHQIKRTRAMSEETADTVNYVLEQNVQRGTGTAARIGQPVAGKTGTTEGNGDAWFVGYTPTLATAVWMGYPEGSARKMSNVRGIQVTGGSFPAQIFGRYMRTATEGVDNDGFKVPPDLGRPRDDPPATTVAPPTSSTEVPTTLSPTTTAELRPVPEGENGRPSVRPGGGSTTTTTTRRNGGNGNRNGNGGDDEDQPVRNRVVGGVTVPERT